jgi:cytosine/adenosine deaminase-related metal-dependent hydrolase
VLDIADEIFGNNNNNGNNNNENNNTSLGFMTLVHCTHSRSDELKEYLRRGGNICVCPLTEGSLADGIFLADGESIGGRMLKGGNSNNNSTSNNSNSSNTDFESSWSANNDSGTNNNSSINNPSTNNPSTNNSSNNPHAPVSTMPPSTKMQIVLGSDSNLRVDLLEEARWLEYGQRWASQKRGHFSVPELIDIITKNGARSLQLDVGEIKPGMFADFVVLCGDKNGSGIRRRIRV